MVYSDVSHGNLPDGYSSSLGFIIVLAELSGNPFRLHGNLEKFTVLVEAVDLGNQKSFVFESKLFRSKLKSSASLHKNDSFVET